MADEHTAPYNPNLPVYNPDPAPKNYGAGRNLIDIVAIQEPIPCPNYRIMQTETWTPHISDCLELTLRPPVIGDDQLEKDIYEYWGTKPYVQIRLSESGQWMEVWHRAEEEDWTLWQYGLPADPLWRHEREIQVTFT